MLEATVVLLIIGPHTLVLLGVPCIVALEYVPGPAFARGSTRGLQSGWSRLRAVGARTTVEALGTLR
jgi:hypothetical protein